jgi:hypothetical protein
VLTTEPFDPILDLAPWVGQRQATFRFDVTDRVSGLVLGQITPTRDATLTHDTTRTIKRQLNLNLGKTDTANIEPLTQRIDVTMIVNGVEWPLGRYMFTDDGRQTFTSGQLGSVVLSDEMFLVDQQITSGINARGISVNNAILNVVAGLPVTLVVENTPFTAGESWNVGSARGQVLETLSISGDYFSPWFGNDRRMHFIRTFDPATQLPRFDFNAGNKVIREPIVNTSDLLTAPNVFIVVSNAGDNTTAPVVGRYDVPPSAPHSKANRGFEIPDTRDLQVTDSVQASAVAIGLGLRQTIFERVTLTTAPDPRHDSYDVIHWQGDLWLELAWSMALVEGGVMNHILRKSYRG